MLKFMRKNILPHFLNRDAREIIRFGAAASRSACERFLEHALRVAVLLSESAAIIPPGHFLESDLAFGVITKNRVFLDAGVIELPLRETNLVDLMEKKRSEYGSVRHRFPGLFDDNRIRLFEEIQPYFKCRRTRIGQEATQNWAAGPDTCSHWIELKAVHTLATIDLLRRAPQNLLLSGEALTWPALIEHLNDEVISDPTLTRVALQKNYFSLYMDEYQADMLCNLPYGFDVYLAGDNDLSYSYRSLVSVMHALGSSWSLRMTPENTVRLKVSAGWTAFADAFVQLQARSDTPTNVIAAFSRAARDVRYSGAAVDEIGSGRPADRTATIDEFCDALGAMAARVSSDYALSVRMAVEPNVAVPVGSRFKPHANSQVSRASRNEGKMFGSMRQVFIATSNEREAKAVRDTLVRFVGAEDAIAFNSDAVVPRFSARMNTKKGQVLIDLGLAYETGGDEAVDLLRRYMAEEQPNAVFFVGCSGLLDEKQEHEEDLVFVAKRALDADKRTLTDETPVYDGDMYHGDSRLRNMLAMLNSAGFFKPLKVVTNRDFVSSGAFHKSKKSPERRALVEDFPPDAVVIEMEALAVYKELWRLRERGSDVSILVVKGISDLGDEHAQDGKSESQHRATGNAATVVLKLLLEIGG